MKKIILTSFIVFSLIAIIYPSKKEDTSLFDFCYSLEKILTENSIQKRKNVSLKIKSISKDIAKFGVSKTRGFLISNMIDKYKTSKNIQIIKLVPNKFYCLAGYWIEKVKPGTFEQIIYAKSKKTINEYKDFKDEVDVLLNDINSEYEIIKKEFNSIF